MVDGHKPLIGTDSCQATHTGIIVSGSVHCVCDDGSKLHTKPVRHMQFHRCTMPGSSETNLRSFMSLQECGANKLDQTTSNRYWSRLTPWPFFLATKSARF